MTNSGGYFLLYRVGGSGGGGAAARTCSTQNRSGTVSLLVTLLPADSAAGAAPATVDVRPFHNTALVTENLPDPTAPVYVAPPRYPLPADPGTLQALADGLGLPVRTLGAANAVTADLLVAGRTGDRRRRAPIGAAGRDPPRRRDGARRPARRRRRRGRRRRRRRPAGDAAVPLPGLATRAVPSAPARRASASCGGPRPGRRRRRRARPRAHRAGRPGHQAGRALQPRRVPARRRRRFRASGDGLPVGPAQQGGRHPRPRDHGRRRRAGVDLRQAGADRPVRHRQAPSPPVPGPDPYGGVGGTAEVVWHHQDVFGNRILPRGSSRCPVRYTDALLGLAQWPSIVAAYRVVGDPGAAVLSVRARPRRRHVRALPAGDPVAPLGPDGGPGRASGLAARATRRPGRYASACVAARP